MRILFYGINFAPELTATGKYNGELVRWLSNRGHQIDVITAHPFYPEWKVKSEYLGKGWFTESEHNIRIFRTPLYIPKQVTGKTRIFHELSFGFNSLWFWAKCFFRKYDVVIGICPPLQTGLLPLIYSKIRGTPCVFHIQDLQVDAAVKLNLISNKWLIKILEKVEDFILEKSSIVSSISEGMKKNIIAKGVNPSKYFMIENWVDIDFLRPSAGSLDFRKTNGIHLNQKVILYSGNIGEKQGLEIVVDVASLLQENENVIFVVCGEGMAKQKLIEYAISSKVKNILFLPVQPYNLLPDLLSMADIHLVIQKKATTDLVMPSKLSGILACGGVSIVTTEKNSTLEALIHSNKMGFTVEPESVSQLAKAISEILTLENNGIQNIRLRAREYAELHLNKENILSRLESKLESVV